MIIDFMPQRKQSAMWKSRLYQTGTETVDHVDGSIPLWKILSKVTQEWDFSLQNDKE